MLCVLGIILPHHASIPGAGCASNAFIRCNAASNAASFAQVVTANRTALGAATPASENSSPGRTLIPSRAQAIAKLDARHPVGIRSQIKGARPGCEDGDTVAILIGGCHHPLQIRWRGFDPKGVDRDVLGGREERDQKQQ